MIYASTKCSISLAAYYRPLLSLILAGAYEPPYVPGLVTDTHDGMIVLHTVMTSTS